MADRGSVASLATATGTDVTPSERGVLAGVEAALARAVRYELRGWLAGWRSDGGDARRFRRAVRGRFGDDEAGAWRYSERMLTPRRLQIRHVARALLVHPRYLPYAVVAALADRA